MTAASTLARHLKSEARRLAQADPREAKALARHAAQLEARPHFNPAVKGNFE